MGTRIVIANLLKQEGRRPCIRFEDVQLCYNLHDCKESFVIGFYKLSHGDVRADYGSLSSEKQCKALSRGVSAAATLTQLLNRKMPVCDGLGGETEMCLDGFLPSVITGNTVIIADEAFSESQIETHSWNLFLSTEFHFPTVSADKKRGLISTQHLQISCPTLNLEDSLFSEYDTPVFDHIEIVSGVCIFNGDTLKTSISHSGSGRVDPEKLNNAKPTFHEMEYIARSSSAIADIAAMVISRIREHGSTLLVRISLDVPSFHYYHSVVRKFEEGLCTAEDALKWMDAVDLRHDQIFQVFTHSVQHELLRRGVTPAWYEIRTSLRTTSAAISIRQALQGGAIPSLEDVLQNLDDEKDGLWRDFYQLITTKERPRDLGDLGNLFYVFEVVKPALIKTATRYQLTSMPERTNRAKSTFKGQLDSKSANKTKSKSRCLILTIDDPAERRIYSRSQEALRKIRGSRTHMMNPTLVEVYMCRRVFVNGNKTRSRLYHQDPMPEVPVLCRSSDYNNSAVQLIEPLGVVRQLYGSDCARNLQLWFASVGLEV